MIPMDHEKIWVDFNGCLSASDIGAFFYILFRINEFEDVKMVEVGSWKGYSSFCLMTILRGFNKKGRLWCVDIWDNYDEPSDPGSMILNEYMNKGGDQVYEKFKRNINTVGLSDQIIPMRMMSVEAAKEFEDDSLDLVFIDAAHGYKDVIDDINAWFPKVKSGGFIAGHDIDFTEVKNAVCEFALKVSNHNVFQVIDSRVWAHRKE